MPGFADTVTYDNITTENVNAIWQSLRRKEEHQHKAKTTV